MRLLLHANQLKQFAAPVRLSAASFMDIHGGSLLNMLWSFGLWLAFDKVLDGSIGHCCSLVGWLFVLLTESLMVRLQAFVH